jgi:Fe-Mn family superoxide dismutase
LDELIVTTSKDKSKIAIYNHAAEAWNHNFFWQCMSSTPGEPGSNLKANFDMHFGGFEAFKKKVGYPSS